jgi:phage terminase Nu1 subunit (DNA packaging protein)
MHQQQWVTAAELAESYAVKVPTVRKWVRQGVPCLKVSQRLVRFDPVAVQSWLQKRSKEVTH